MGQAPQKQIHMSKKYIVIAGIILLLAAAFVFFRFTDAGTNVLWSMSSGGTALLPLVSVAALIDSVNPCAFSILLITVGFLLSAGMARRSILKMGAAYIAGLFAVYLLIGLGLLQALHLFNTPHFMAKVGAGVLIAFGVINLLNELFPAFPIKFRIPSAAHGKIAELMNRTSLPAVFLLGALVGLCEFPCTGGPYLMVLGLLHDADTYFSGVGYLLLYNLIFVLPLVFILLLASNGSLLAKVQEWKKREMKHMKLWTGIAMVALGILILFI
jgi:cytochrome c-type biogenesis protein